ncbi:c-type cytochrome [Bradyrhizobium sp.]|uniref:c-type cytochrome n=1 Tax=Bradyrhizobium sp. TaxID=376 RepID=UPI003C74A184
MLAPRAFKGADAPLQNQIIMKLDMDFKALLAAVLAVSLTCALPATAQPAANAPDSGAFDVEQLFASICGFCHSEGGRAAGRGPQLMNSPRDDDYLRNRIKNGKDGAMPAFGTAFTDAQIDDMVKFIRSLKPREG